MEPSTIPTAKEGRQEQPTKKTNLKMQSRHQQNTEMDDASTKDGEVDPGNAEYQSYNVDTSAYVNDLDGANDDDANEEKEDEKTFASEDAPEEQDESAASSNGNEPIAAARRKSMHLHVQESPGSISPLGREERFRFVPVIDEHCVSPEPGSALYVSGPFPSSFSPAPKLETQYSKASIIFAGIAALFGVTALALHCNSLAGIYNLSLTSVMEEFGTSRLLQVGLPVIGPLFLLHHLKSSDREDDTSEEYSLTSNCCSSSGKHSDKSNIAPEKNRDKARGMGITILITALATSLVWCGLIITQLNWKHKEEPTPFYQSNNMLPLFAITILAALTTIFMYIMKGPDKVTNIKRFLHIQGDVA